MDDEEQRLREIARRPSPLKGLLDIGSTIGTYGVEKAREMPDRAVQDIKNAIVAPAESAYHAGRQIVGEEPYDRDEAIKHALNIANAMTLGAGAYEAPAGAVRSGWSRAGKPLMAAHNLDERKIQLAHRAGGYAAPSVAIKDVESPYQQFGRVTLLGDKSFAVPSQHTRVYKGDAYTPPTLLEGVSADKIAAEILSNPHQITAVNAYNPAQLRAFHTPEFKTFDEIKNASHLLGSREREGKFVANYEKYLDNLKERMMPYFSGYSTSPEWGFHQSLADPTFRAKNFPRLPADIEEDIAALPSFLHEAPQEYFESKVQGVANPGELSFKGAIVPHHLGPTIDPLLRDMKIKDIFHTDTDDPERLVRAYEQFKHLRFADGGSVKDPVVEDNLTGFSYLPTETRQYPKGVQKEYAPNPVQALGDMVRSYGMRKPYKASPEDELMLRHLVQNLQGTTTPQDIERPRADVTPFTPTDTTPYQRTATTPSFADFDRKRMLRSIYDLPGENYVLGGSDFGHSALQGSTAQRSKTEDLRDVAETLAQGKIHANIYKRDYRDYAGHNDVVAQDDEGVPYPPHRPNAFAEGGAAWTRKEGKNPEGGLNAKGRASYNRQNPGKPGLKPPAPHPKTERDASRRASFCARMKGMKAKLTSSEIANDPDSRINKSLRAWNCRADGGPIMHPDIIDALRLAERRNFDDGGSAYDGNPFSRSSRGGLFSKMTPQSSFASAAPSTTPAQSQMNPFLRQAASPLMSLPAPPMPVLRQDYTAPTPQIAPPMPVLRQSPQAPTPQIAPPMPVLRQSPQAPTPQIAPPMAAPMAAAAPNQNPVLRSDSMPAPVQNYAAPIQNYAAPVQNYAAPVENYISPETAPRQNPVLRQDYAAPAAPQQNSTSLNDAIPAPMQQNPVLRTDTPSPATANQNYDRPMISSAQGYDQPMTSASNYAQPTAQTQNSAPAVSSSPVFDKTEADRPYYTPSAQQNSAALNDVIPTPAQTYNQPLTSSPSFTQQAPQAQNFMQPQSQPAPSGYSQPQSQAATTSQQVSSNPNVTSDYQAMLARLPRALSDYIYQPTNMSQSGFGGYTPQSYNYAGNQSSFFNRNSGGYPYAQRQYQAPRQYSYPQQYQYPQTQMAQRNTMPFVGKNGGGSSWGRI